MPSDVPGVRRNELASGWMASLRATGVDRACCPRWRLAQRTAANTRQGVHSALARRPPHTGSAPVRLPAVEHGCSSRGRGEGHSPPCLKAGALWPQNGRPYLPLLKRTTLLTSPQARGKKALPSCTTCREPRRVHAGNRSGVTPPVYDGALIPDLGGKRCA